MLGLAGSKRTVTMS